ncbi:MAG: DUF1684 domain-containing protein [Flavobacteriaceae bacterium]|nr:DUF1684 domain-containing protein [Flavobacteriaceae bacterium]
MRNIFIILISFLSFASVAQTKAEIVEEIEAFRTSENEKFGAKETTILTSKDFRKFKELEFYKIDLNFRVEARFVRTPNEEPFLMPTTTSRLPEYVKYGEAHFEIEGEKLKLNLYQNTTPSEDPEYIDHLFLPFTDYTSGDGSYGGGRFIDSHIPEGDTIIINFNLAYNPYCAYNHNYSCPIPPKENDLLVRIEAGVKDFGKH